MIGSAHARTFMNTVMPPQLVTSALEKRYGHPGGNNLVENRAKCGGFSRAIAHRPQND